MLMNCIRSNITHLSMNNFCGTIADSRFFFNKVLRYLDEVLLGVNDACL